MSTCVNVQYGILFIVSLLEFPKQNGGRRSLGISARKKEVTRKNK